MARLIFCLGLWLTMALFVALGYALGTDGHRQSASPISHRAQESRITSADRGDCFFGDLVGVQ